MLPLASLSEPPPALGAGGNVTVAVGTNGVIMVDSEFAPMHDKLKAAIAAVTKQPLQVLH